MNQDDLQWFGMDWNAPHPLDNGLSTVEVDDIESPLQPLQEEYLRGINVCGISTCFGIDIFVNAINYVKSRDT